MAWRRCIFNHSSEIGHAARRRAVRETPTTSESLPHTGGALRIGSDNVVRRTGAWSRLSGPQRAQFDQRTVELTVKTPLRRTDARLSTHPGTMS